MSLSTARVHVRRGVVVAAIAVVFHGCSSPWVQTEIVCRLPDSPPVWAAAWGEPVYDVAYSTAVDPEPREVVRSVPASGAVVVRVPNAPPVVVTATPVWESGGPATSGDETLAPCGAIWPYELSDQRELPLAWELGPTAWVVRRAASAGVRTDRLNVTRLSLEIATRIPSDPWLLDRAKVVDALVGNRMRVTAIRPVEPESTGLAAPDGEWIAFSPFAAPLYDGDSISVVSGSTVWYGSDGRRLVVTLNDHDAWLAVFGP